MFTLLKAARALSIKNHQEKLQQIKQFVNHPALATSLEAVAKQRYKTPMFVLQETLKGFTRHNVLGLSASLSFYALFALIPMILLIFFLLSHLVTSSDYAIVKLAILTGNLVPDFSSSIMVEVYAVSKQKAAWGAVGLFLLLWTVTPLAGAMRSAFYTISALIEAPSFIKRKFKDVFAVLGILFLLFLFTFAGLVIEKAVLFLGSLLPKAGLELVGASSSMIITTLLMALFYHIFFPMRVAVRHLLIGSFFTALLWLMVRPAFGLFLSVDQNYGAVFGGMKTMFIAITWLYFNFAVFLLGTELIATLRKKDMLLLKGLFDGSSMNIPFYKEALLKRYGISLHLGDYVFETGNTEHKLYYIVDGAVNIVQKETITRQLKADDYFGEMALLTDSPTIADAIIASTSAEIVVIYPEQIETLLTDEPKVAMQFLREMAVRLQGR